MKASALAESVTEGANLLGVFLCTGALAVLRARGTAVEVNALLAEGLAKYGPSFRAMRKLVKGAKEVEPARRLRDARRRVPAALRAMDSLVRLVSADPALATRVLSAAAARAGREAPASLPLAIARIGEAELVRIAREGAREASAPRGPLAEQRRAAWRSAVACAVLSREPARVRRLDAEAAWLCGLLHDVGRIACLSAIEHLAAGARPARAADSCCDGLVGCRWGRRRRPPGRRSPAGRETVPARRQYPIAQPSLRDSLAPERTPLSGSRATAW